MLISDGRRALGAWGAPRDVRLLEAAVGREGEGAVALQDTAWGAAAQEVTPGCGSGPATGSPTSRPPSCQRTAPASGCMWGLAARCGAAVRRAVAAAATPRSAGRSPRRPRSLEAERAVARRAAGAGPDAPVASNRHVPTGVGTPLGRYVLLDRIGEGGMAEVFTAVSFGSGGFRRTFVIKRLRAEMASNPVAVAHFIDEANLASTLVHPNIVPVFDFGEVAGSYFLAQEYVVGRDLGRLARRMTEQNVARLSVSAALYVAHEVLRGLHHAHEKRADDGTPLELVHRDVTPENVMISERGEVKILDFGIVKAIQRVSQTDIGMVKGNVDYMSPEQARGRAVDRRSDVFSAGLVLYFALARTPALPGRHALRSAHAGRARSRAPRSWSGSPPCPRRCRRSWGARWPSIPDDRFQTALGVRPGAGALHRGRSGRGGGRAGAAVRRRAAARAGPPGRRLPARAGPRAGGARPT